MTNAGLSRTVAGNRERVDRIPSNGFPVCDQHCNPDLPRLTQRIFIAARPCAGTSVAGADRLALGTPYARIVDWVRTRAAEYCKSLKAIVVDATGLGSAVMDLFHDVRLDARVIGVQITGAQSDGVPEGVSEDGVIDIAPDRHSNRHAG